MYIYIYIYIYTHIFFTDVGMVTHAWTLNLQNKQKQHKQTNTTDDKQATTTINMTNKKQTSSMFGLSARPPRYEVGFAPLVEEKSMTKWVEAGMLSCMIL